jgi:exonuclease III
MKVITWNLRRATKERELVWEYFHELDPDIALLQEVGSIPNSIDTKYSIIQRSPRTKYGSLQKFKTALLVKGQVSKQLSFNTKWVWVNEELEKYSGNLIGAEVLLGNGERVNVLNVYSPAWPIISRERLEEVNASDLQLKNNPDFWLTELMYAGVLSMDLKDLPWIIGGDLNASVTFDTMWPGGPRGNQEIMDRMANLGLPECLKHYQGKLTPTFRNPSNQKVIHQIDHLFINDRLIQRMRSCSTGSPDRVFANSLSDHLPIIAKFD